ncbi:MAG: hypothetical protein V3T13_01345, partial [Hyphomicrobium sp.]
MTTRDRLTAFTPEGMVTGSGAGWVLDHLTVAIDERCRAGAQKDRTGRELLCSHWQDAHAERP